jgi:hypothetical protein
MFSTNSSTLVHPPVHFPPRTAPEPTPTAGTFSWNENCTIILSFTFNISGQQKIKLKCWLILPSLKLKTLQTGSDWCAGWYRTCYCRFWCDEGRPYSWDRSVLSPSPKPRKSNQVFLPNSVPISHLTQVCVTSILKGSDYGVMISNNLALELYPSSNIFL